ncbi:MAG: AraC family transcriptional regulator [Anaerocolumna sp.]|jgi:iron complex transport system substrate-binding protein|nr:AraC family transcriptional regulator [Anaerocolumna sp.]
MKSLNKKKILALLCISVILVLTGCKNTDTKLDNMKVDTIEPTIPLETEEKTDSTESTRGTLAQETSGQVTQTISTNNGDVIIPVNPQRIVSFGNPGDLVAMGVIPVAGNSEARLFDGLLTEDNYTYLGPEDYEEIMALEPDLILVSYAPEQSVYDKLSAIAPTVLTDAISLSLPERIVLTGKIIGKVAEAEKAMADYEAQAEAYKAQLISAGIDNKTVTIMEGPYLFGDKYGRGADIVYNYLGFSAPPKLQEIFDNGDKYLEVSMEVLSEYCGDYLINSVWNGSEDLSQNDVWNSIPAVKEGRLIEVDFSDYFSNDLYTSSKQMKLLAETFLSLE